MATTSRTASACRYGRVHRGVSGTCRVRIHVDTAHRSPPPHRDRDGLARRRCRCGSSRLGLRLGSSRGGGVRGRPRRRSRPNDVHRTTTLFGGSPWLGSVHRSIAPLPTETTAPPVVSLPAERSARGAGRSRVLRRTRASAPQLSATHLTGETAQRRAASPPPSWSRNLCSAAKAGLGNCAMHDSQGIPAMNGTASADPGLIRRPQTAVRNSGATGDSGTGTRWHTRCLSVTTDPSGCLGRRRTSTNALCSLIACAWRGTTNGQSSPPLVVLAEPSQDGEPRRIGSMAVRERVPSGLVGTCLRRWRGTSRDSPLIALRTPHP